VKRSSLRDNLASVKRVIWKPDSVLSVRVKPSLFTVAQMRSGSYLQFFDMRNDNGVWDGVDLNQVAPLFCIGVAMTRLRKLFVDVLSANQVKPNRRAMPLQVINFGYGCGGENKADLVELTHDLPLERDNFSTIGAKIIKAGLTIEQDLQIIYSHELAGMVGDPEKLCNRLATYFETGVNWDPAKGFVFKGITPPPPSSAPTFPQNRRHLPESEPPPQPPSSPRRRSRIEGHAPLRRKLRVLFAELEAELESLPKQCTETQKLVPFQRCLEAVNRFADEIQTVERESILEAIYRLGETVGLNPDSQFAERWRGDW
jgi:hypothetical protein